MLGLRNLDGLLYHLPGFPRGPKSQPSLLDLLLDCNL